MKWFAICSHVQAIKNTFSILCPKSKNKTTTLRVKLWKQKDRVEFEEMYNLRLKTCQIIDQDISYLAAYFCRPVQ